MSIWTSSAEESVVRWWKVWVSWASVSEFGVNEAEARRKDDHAAARQRSGMPFQVRVMS